MMRINLTYGLIASFALYMLSSAYAAEVKWVGTEISGMGDEYASSQWRDPAVTKYFDPDGDNIIGTDGWKWFAWDGTAGNDKYSTSTSDDDSLPAYITSIGSTPAGYNGDNGWGYFQDPMNTSSSNRSYGLSGADFSITIVRATTNAFRLTLFGSVSTTLESTIKVSTAGSDTIDGTNSATFSITAAQLWYMWFDVGPGSDNVTVTFTRITGDNRGLTGMAFDPISSVIADRTASTFTYLTTKKTGDSGFVGPEWNTASVTKTNDIDENNVFGTDGWKWFGYDYVSQQANLGKFDQYSLPSYIHSIGSTPLVYQISPSSNWADFDDPLNPGSDLDAVYGYGTSDFDFSIIRKNSRAFRLMLFGSANGIAGSVILSNATVSGTSATGTYSITTGQRWYMWFDVGEGTDNVDVRIEQTSGDQRGLTGIAFDSLEKATMFMFQ